MYFRHNKILNEKIWDILVLNFKKLMTHNCVLIYHVLKNVEIVLNWEKKLKNSNFLGLSVRFKLLQNYKTKFALENYLLYNYQQSNLRHKYIIRQCVDICQDYSLVNIPGNSLFQNILLSKLEDRTQKGIIIGINYYIYRGKTIHIISYISSL